MKKTRNAVQLVVIQRVPFKKVNSATAFVIRNTFIFIYVCVCVCVCVCIRDAIHVYNVYTILYTLCVYVCIYIFGCVCNV
jgi:hypothetical protein